MLVINFSKANSRNHACFQRRCQHCATMQLMVQQVHVKTAQRDTHEVPPRIHRLVIPWFGPQTLTELVNTISVATSYDR